MGDSNPAPCPICRRAPTIDYGPSDAPFGTPLVQCATVHVDMPGHAERCPMAASGVPNWNALAAKFKGEA